MPELPEVETVKRGLNQVTRNQKILGGDVLLERTIAHPIPVTNFLAGLQNTTIQHWHRRGKYLLAELGTQQEGRGKKAINIFPDSPTPLSSYLGVHLRMTGQLLWVDQGEPLQKHTRVRLFFPKNRELRFVDQRTFGQMWWVPQGTPIDQVITGLQNLGPEPFSDEFSVSYLAHKLQHRQRLIKPALLDQALVAGVGNIYADEALFLSGVRPTRLCQDLSWEEVSRLHTAIVQVLAAAIQAGGTTFSDFLNVQGINGNYGGEAWVYNRTGEPCRVCSAAIERRKLAGRSSHFCPQCQV